MEIKLTVNIVAPINTLGYGVAGYNLFKELYKMNRFTALYPISKPEFVDEYVQSGIENQKLVIRENKFRCITHGMNIPKSETCCIAKSSPSVKVWHQNELHTNVGTGLQIGFPIFELTEFTQEEILSMSHCDKLFVCSEWAKDVLYNHKGWTCPPVHVVPLGVDNNIFQPKLSTRTETIFFNCGKWEKRKGHDVLLECFNRAFTPSDNVELWMMCDNPFIGTMNEQWKNLYKNSPLGSKIRIIPRQKTHKDVYNIMSQADCGVFPARAEGWNLELLEMMSCGKHVIATNYSAHTEFCNKDNCMLVDIDGLEQAKDGVFFSGSHGEWATISENSKEQIVEHMRNAHRLKQAFSNTIPNPKGIETANQFTWKHSAQELLNGL